MLFVLIAISFTLVYFLYRTKYSYWEQRKVKFPKPIPFLGNYAGYILLQDHIGEAVHKICEKFPEESIIGAYYGTDPVLIVQDPEIIKLVTTQEYYYFSSREISEYLHNEVFTQSLFFTYGDTWKALRQNLTPLFSTGKMKNMFHLIKDCSNRFEVMLEKETLATISHDGEVRSLIARYTMDCIGACIFGMDTKAMLDPDENPFRTIGDKIFELTYGRGIKTVARSVWPYIFYGLGFKTFPIEVNNFFGQVLRKVYNERKEKPSVRGDFVDLLCKFLDADKIYADKIENMKKGASDCGKVSLDIDENVLISQSIALFVAGFETSSNTLAFTLYELAKNMDCQILAIQEVDKYLLARNGVLEYDCVSELPYLSNCVDEALRLYPVLGVITREVYNDYTMPNGIKLEKGLRVHLPVYHLQRNPKYFPEPNKFCPERFLPQEKHKIVPYTYFPFGEGPRICIGTRFARMQMMAGLVSFFKNYTVEPSHLTPNQLKIEPKGFVTVTKTGIHLKIKRRIK